MYAPNWFEQNISTLPEQYYIEINIRNTRLFVYPISLPTYKRIAADKSRRGRHENRRRNAGPVDAERRRVGRVHRGGVLFPVRVVVLVLRAGRRLRAGAGLQVPAVRHELRGRRFRGRRQVRVPVRRVLAAGVRRARCLHVRALRLPVATVPPPGPPPSPAPPAGRDSGREQTRERHQRLQQSTDTDRWFDDLCCNHSRSHGVKYVYCIDCTEQRIYFDLSAVRASSEKFFDGFRKHGGIDNKSYVLWDNLRFHGLLTTAIETGDI